MKNSDVVAEWLSGGPPAEGSNLRFNRRVLYSYRTPIAVRVGDNTVFLNSAYYSSTTSRHKSLVTKACAGMGRRIQHVDPQEPLFAELVQEALAP